MHIGRGLWQVILITVLLTQGTVGMAFAAEAPLANNAATATVSLISSTQSADVINDGELGDRALQRSSARIGLIIVEVDNVFDPNDPRENSILYRAANALHIKTRRKTILTQLLFKEGDTYNRHALDESARNLRANSYLNEAEIKPVQYHADDNTVDVLVRVHDVWTFNPGIAYGRSGGTNHSGIQLAEGNLLGYGKSLSLQSNQDVDRTELGVSYSDPNLLSSRWQLTSMLIDASDGGTKQLSIAHPFFSLDTRWASLVSGLNEQRIDKRYQLGNLVDQYKTTHENYEAQLGWSNGLQDGWVHRWMGGFRVERFHYEPDPILGTIQLPQDKHLAYPWVGLQWLEDQYEVTHNRDQITRTEDVYYGRSLSVQIGESSAAFGSDHQADLLQLNFQDAWHVGERHSIFLTTGIDGQYQDNQWRDTFINTSLRYDYRRGPTGLFTMTFKSVYGIHLDPSLPLYLGDDDGNGEIGNGGLRGYPLHYRSGSHREVLNIEQRFYSNWQLLRLLTVGAVAFVDVGHIGGGGVNADDNQTLSDVGIGLRLGSIRSSKGEVFHINAAYPLNATGTQRKLQLQVLTKQSF